MRYFLFTFLLFTVCASSSYAADAMNLSVETRNFSVDMEAQQDSLSKGKEKEKKTVDKDKKETLPQAEEALKVIPKAKNKAIPRAVIVPVIKITSPRIAPVKVKIKVKVKTQVRIKL